ncbi:MAG: hypothetical protein KC635_18310 [Myxococcales bacterium]|nr:hypothetical protein [Myxococcales bacterium]MCB9735508.1 hypothetical protein [Deltaproteobacteria bacterium]
MSKSEKRRTKNEGEGNRTADRRYREGVREHIRESDVESEAKAAEEALAGKEGQSLREAEEAGKNRAKESDR